MDFQILLRMAESCPSTDRNDFSDCTVPVNRESEIHKQDTSPSPTETVCLDPFCTENLPGKITVDIFIFSLFVKLNIYVLQLHFSYMNFFNQFLKCSVFHYSRKVIHVIFFHFTLKVKETVTSWKL